MNNEGRSNTGRGQLSEKLQDDTVGRLLGHLYGEAQKGQGKYTPDSKAPYNVNGYLALIAYRQYITWCILGWLGLVFSVAVSLTMIWITIRSENENPVHIYSIFCVTSLAILFSFWIFAFWKSEKYSLTENTRKFALNFRSFMSRAKGTSMITRIQGQLFPLNSWPALVRVKVLSNEVGDYWAVVAANVLSLIEDTAIMLYQYNNEPNVPMANKTKRLLNNLITFAKDMNLWQENTETGRPTKMAELLAWAQSNARREYTERSPSPIQRFEIGAREDEAVEVGQVCNSPTTVKPVSNSVPTT